MLKLYTFLGVLMLAGLITVGVITVIYQIHNSLSTNQCSITCIKDKH